MSTGYNRKDRLYQKAKESGYRSRAAYKLLELNNKHKFLKKGVSVLDLGCFPGGWVQVASEIVGPGGITVGVDLADVEPFKAGSSPVHILKGDLYAEESKNWIRGIHQRPFDLIMSDMSPKLSGIKDRDQVASSELFALAIIYCSYFLKKGGNFICKIFPGKETEEVFLGSKKAFKTFTRTSLDSSRNSSNELYVIGKGFQGVD